MDGQTDKQTHQSSSSEPNNRKEEGVPSVLSVVEVALDLHLQALDEELEGAGGGEGRAGLGRTQALPVRLRARHLLGDLFFVKNFIS